MHYYQFNIADYRADTTHLTAIEHFIYRELLDWIYLDECEIPKNNQKVLRRLRLGSENEPELINVLSDFFKESDSGWIQERAFQEIETYKAKLSQLRKNGSKGGRPRKSKDHPENENQNKPNGLQKETKSKPDEKVTINYKPLTNNQEPLTTNQNPKSENKFSDEDLEFSEYAYKKILGPAPKTKIPDLTKWADSVRLMREADKHTPQEIMQVFTFANNDPFWQTNILSIPKLRTKFSALHSKMIGDKNNANGTQFSNSRKISRSDRADQEARDYIQKHGLS